MEDLVQKYIVEPFKTGTVSFGIILLYIVIVFIVIAICIGGSILIMMFIFKHFWLSTIVALIIGIWYLGYRQAELRKVALDRFNSDEEESIIGLFKMITAEIKEDYNVWKNRKKFNGKIQNR